MRSPRARKRLPAPETGVRRVRPVEGAFLAPKTIAPALDEEQAWPFGTSPARCEAEALRAIGGEHRLHLARDQSGKNGMAARGGGRGDVGGEGDQRSSENIGDDEIVGRAVADRGMIGSRCNRECELPAAAA